MFTDTLTKDVFVDELTVAGSAFGATAEGEAVAHTYEEDGDYTVCLTVTVKT